MRSASDTRYSRSIVAAQNFASDAPRPSSTWPDRRGHPGRHDVPRRFEPVLRNGALFVPAAQVHVLKPSDGASLGPAVECDLIPDVLRVDERGWLYVAEESGHLRAFAPAAMLSLVR